MAKHIPKPNETQRALHTVSTITARQQARLDSDGPIESQPGDYRIKITPEAAALTAARHELEDRRMAREIEEDAFGAPPPRTKCPHGEPIGSCGACDIASDFAYDSARESSFFRR